VSESDAVSADTHELSLAGKGFSAEIEDEYKKNTDIDYTVVDAVEKITVDDTSEYNFIRDGGLKGADK
jgi:hypothetical protein